MLLEGWNVLATSTKESSEGETFTSAMMFLLNVSFEAFLEESFIFSLAMIRSILNGECNRGFCDALD